jgi:hypothetical protein
MYMPNDNLFIVKLLGGFEVEPNSQIWKAFPVGEKK